MQSESSIIKVNLDKIFTSYDKVIEVGLINAIILLIGPIITDKEKLKSSKILESLFKLYIQNQENKTSKAVEYQNAPHSIFKKSSTINSNASNDKKASKFLTDKSQKVVTIEGTLDNVTNIKVSAKELPQNSQDDKKFGFAFGLLEEKGILPLNLFNYYFEITRYSWIQIVDYPYFNSKLFNFTGKISNFDICNNNVKFELEASRLKQKSKQISNEISYNNKIKVGTVYNNELFIPTSNFIKVSNLLDFAISYHLPILLVGPSESGKTKIVKSKLLTETDKGFSRFVRFNINYKDTIDNVIIYYI